MIDLTEIPSLFRIFSFKLAVVIDVFSRMPLAARVFLGEPGGGGRGGARHAGRLRPRCAQTLRVRPGSAVHSRGLPRQPEDARHPPAFRRHRQDRFHRDRGKAVEDIERGPGPRLLEAADPTGLERRLKPGLVYYAYLRPHQALAGASPAQVYFGIRPAYLSAVSLPRGRPGQRSAGLG